MISNGTAILGLGNLGALASKPVMEGKAVLFKRFADVDSIDLEVDTEDVDEFINAVRYLGPSFGGINLEDIKAPECFIIEERLRELMDIPVFHDDQHGTAIIAAAGLHQRPAAHRPRHQDDASSSCNGAGAAGIACLELIKAMGFAARERHPLRHQGRHLPGPHRGHEPVEVGPRGRDRGAHAGRGAWRAPTSFFGLSAKGAVTADDGQVDGRRTRSSSPWPIPIRRSRRRRSHAVRADAIIATGRSDYPNQVNNVLGFPYIFRGALDVRATDDQRWR